jgi:hypothetical protein
MPVVIDGTTGITTPGINNSGTLTQTGAATMSNTLQTATTIGVGAATPSTSGAGITFPATQSASTNANTLDDYEEGTWTPVLVPGTGTITSQGTYGGYVKIGKQVTLTFKAVITGGTVTGISSIEGFPFTVENTVQQACGSAREEQATGFMWEVATSANTTIANLRRYDNSATVNNAYGWQGSVTYITV